MRQQIYRLTTKHSNDGNFECRILRINRDHGSLEIINLDTHERVVQEVVRLSFGALFGPDVADVADWERRFAEYLDTRRVH
jgi:hypothetical protein